MLLTLLLISLAAGRKRVKRVMSALVGKIAAHRADRFIVNVRSA